MTGRLDRLQASALVLAGRRDSVDKVLLVIAALALVLRLYGLGDQSIWADELQRIVWSKGYEFKHVLGLLPSELEVRLAPRDLPTAIGILVGHNPPLYGTVLHGWMVLTGSASDFVLRLPSVFFGVVTVIAVYFAILEIGGTSAARWGSTLIAVWPFHVFYAQEINHYTLGTALWQEALWSISGECELRASRTVLDFLHAYWLVCLPTTSLASHLPFRLSVCWSM